MAWADDGGVSVNKKLGASDKKFSSQLMDGYRGIDWSPVNAMSYTDDQIVPVGKRFVSPNKRFCIELKKDKYEFLFVVTDKTTGQASQFNAASNPVFAVDWSPDSQTFVAVEHLAHTSRIELVHWNGKSWCQFPVDPRDEGYDNSHVVDWEFEKGYIKTTYLLDAISDDHRSVSCYTSTFHVDPVTGEISDIKKTEITPEEYAALRTGRN